jgi:excinuclease ABC subunit C
VFEELKKKVSRFPDLPGVYLLKDQQDRIIYVGKAGSLRKRVRSYLTDKVDFSPRLRSLQNQLVAIDYLVTDSEVEALILECSLIKEYRPRFNVNLKDDKDYPYLMITPELYPRLELLRLSQKSSRKARFELYPGRAERRFGPYTDVGSVRDTLNFLGSVFPLRRCRQPLDGKATTERPCLNYQMRRCLAPCRGKEAVSPEDYGQMVQQIVLFLEGRHGELEKDLKKEMERAATAEQFEKAAALRDRYLALQRVAGQQQKMLLTGGSPDRDILALARKEKDAAVHLFMVRDGKLLSQKHFNLTGTEGLEDAEVLASFVKSYYSRIDKPPAEILLSAEPADAELLSVWLSNKTGCKVKLWAPKRGSLHKLVGLAEKNALLKLEEEAELRTRRTEEPLSELGRLLGTDLPPERIEAYDISHLRGGAAVGALVVFINGEADKEEYRRFNIKKAAPGDDYAALAEVLQRRATNATKGPLPDLLLIDGGKGQLSAAVEALRGGPLEEVSIAALAKDPDRLYLVGSSLPVMLPADNTTLQLLQRIRNEVHRFAVSGHRTLKSRSAIRSRLENIPGIGPAKRAALLAAFGSIDRVRQAGIEELARVPGINRALAEKIYAAGRAGLD